MGVSLRSETVQGAGSDPAGVLLRQSDRPQLQLVRKVEIDRSRDALLTDFGEGVQAQLEVQFEGVHPKR